MSMLVNTARYVPMTYDFLQKTILSQQPQLDGVTSNSSDFIHSSD